MYQESKQRACTECVGLGDKGVHQRSHALCNFLQSMLLLLRINLVYKDIHVYTKYSIHHKQLSYDNSTIFYGSVGYHFISPLAYLLYSSARQNRTTYVEHHLINLPVCIMYSGSQCTRACYTHIMAAYDYEHPQCSYIQAYYVTGQQYEDTPNLTFTFKL